MEDEEYNELLEEVEERIEDLKYEYGEDNISEIKINERIRDEFKEQKYKQILIDLDINKENTGLTTKQNKDLTNDNLLSGDNKNLDTLVKTLLDTSNHVKNMDKRIRGYEQDYNGDWQRKLLITIPPIERIKIISFLSSIWTPQNITSNLRLGNKFEESMNRQLQIIRIRLENYPDHIVKAGTIKYILSILLNEVTIVRNAIESGNLGKIATDMITGSYNERAEPPKEINRDEIFKALAK